MKVPSYCVPQLWLHSSYLFGLFPSGSFGLLLTHMHQWFGDLL